MVVVAGLGESGMWRGLLKRGRVLLSREIEVWEGELSDPELIWFDPQLIGLDSESSK